MRSHGQTMLLLAVLLLIAANALSINYHIGKLSILRQECIDLTRQISELVKKQKATILEYWMLRELGIYPRNTSLPWITQGIEAVIFYSSNVSEDDLALKFNSLAKSLNITVTYSSLMDQENVELLKDICLRTGYPEPNLEQSYVVLSNSTRIIFLKLEQVTEEVLRKCVEYLAI